MTPRQTIADRAQYRRFVDAVRRLSTSENAKAFEEKLDRIVRAQNKVFERTENPVLLAPGGHRPGTRCAPAAMK